MTTPTITLYPDTLPAKGQGNAAFDVNVDDYLTWQTVTNGPELAAMITWTVGVRDTVLATALAGDMPPLTGEAGNYLRANAAEDGGEFRTPAEVLGDIGATAALALKAPIDAPTFTGIPAAPTAATTTNTTQLATTGFVQQEIALIPATPAGVTVISETVVSTAVASVDLTGFVPADYTSYEIELINVVPATDTATLNARTSSDGGSSYDSGASDYSYAYTGRVNGSNDDADSAGASSAPLADSVGSAGNENGVSGVVRISGPDLAHRTFATFAINYDDNGGRTGFRAGAFTRRSSADVDGVQIFFSSGNIESGTIVFRGIK